MPTIWCNSHFSGTALELLKAGVKEHRLIFASRLSSSNLAAGTPDSSLGEADIAFGQPAPSDVIRFPQVKWIQLTTAGYTRYDNDEFRAALAARQGILTNSSSVYDQPCAEHALAFMLAHVRQLSQCFSAQSDRSWASAEHRSRSRLLSGQSVVILGFGAIARRLADLLASFGVTITALRRKPDATQGPVQIIGLEELPSALATADHVVNVLPDNPTTRGFMNAARFVEMKRGAVFYNIGRGTTVDQNALLAALESGHVAGAYLDVTDPEPLPAEHPLWTAPNCVITPHTAGGFDSEDEALVRHFLGNLDRFIAGREVIDRVF